LTEGKKCAWVNAAHTSRAREETLSAKIGYILVDIDETVVATNGGDRREYQQGRRQFAHLIGLSNQGVIPPIGFCTGREASYVLGFLRWVAIPNCWSIVESGLILYNPHTQERKEHSSFTPERQEVFKKVKGVHIPRLLEQFPFLIPYKGKEWNIALERGEGAPPIAECERVVKKALAGIPGITIHASSIAVDISPEGIDKGSGVLHLADTTGVDPRTMLLIDDSMGGKPAADQVGFLACPADIEDERFHQEVGRREAEGRGHVSPCKLVEGVVEIICFFTGASLAV
jgi:hydroxymethylpyrimidine pyrophosphatase-like HAD family hydrolase